MKYFLVFLLVAFVRCDEGASGTEEEEIDHVIVGTAANWNELITEDTYALVEFYAPWCGHCKRLEPEYKKAAAQLHAEGSEVKLIKVDATIEKELGSKHGVRGYPTIKFFKKGAPKEYDGGRSQREIVSWINKKLGPVAKDLSDAKAVADFQAENSAVVIAFLEDRDSELGKQFMLVAGELEDVKFGIASIEAGVDLEVTKDSVVVLKTFDDKRANYRGEPNYVPLRKFVAEETMPLLIKFNAENQKRIFNTDTKIHLFFINKEGDEGLAEQKEMIRLLAAEFRGVMIFVDVDIEMKEASRLLDYIGVNSAPAISIMSQASGEGKKYKFSQDEEINFDNVAKFISDVQSGTADPFYKTADEPEDWDATDVKVLVGTSFDRVVNADNTHALVEFYAPWCGHCKKLAPVWDELATKVKANTNLVIAKVDSTENEIPEMGIKSFPTIKFFPANSDKVVDYKGGRTLDEFVKFLKEQLGDEYVEEPAEEETTEEEQTEEEPKVEEKVPREDL